MRSQAAAELLSARSERLGKEIEARTQSAADLLTMRTESLNREIEIAQSIRRRPADVAQRNI